MNKFLFFFIIVLLNVSISVSQQFETQIFDSNIKTLQVNVGGNNLLLPVVELGGNKNIALSFDELSHEAHYYSYRLVHCNADWTASVISTNEFVRGFTQADITDFARSEATVVHYTHYRFSLPNEEMQFTASGNYAVVICEDGKWETPVATACFSVIEPKIAIETNLRGNTDTELNRRLQQLDFDLMLKGFKISDINNDLKVVVRQNNRHDNEVTNLKPAYIAHEKLSYINNKALIFEGGNEFHRFDISSVYNAAHGLESLRFDENNYHAFITPNKINTARTYIHDFDVNGKFLINCQEAVYDANTEADYAYVHFILRKSEPFLDGEVFIGGEWNYNLLNDNALMQYDFADKYYFKTLLLKQGGYNFQYLFLPQNSQTATAEQVEGSFWQTQNEYAVYVYYRPFGARYDRLVGFKTL
ncbi:MAG: DUF5103 domain-containing protein [Paludibacter sp.]|jgi:hypothetical protein|nr:DUF5103 domain-containing protein [Paludibacter sp.]